MRRGRNRTGGPGPTRGEPPPTTDRVASDSSTRAIDRVIRWCLLVFLVSTVVLTAIAWYAVQTGRVAAYLNVAGVVYLVLSTTFLGIIALVFIQGHLGSAREIEAPKLELFEIEDRQ